MPSVKKVKAKKVKVGNALQEEEKPAVQPVISEQLSKKLLKEKKRQAKKERGIVLIKHLPHGFFEEQLKQYFQQFGTVTRLRLVRSRRTGGSRGFAFIEFEYPEVAQVAAETMDNYLMFQKLVKSAYIPPDKQLYNYFKSTVRKVKNKAGKTIYVSSKTAANKRKVDEHNEWSEENTKKRTEENVKKIKKLNEKYKHLGIDFSTICLTPKATEIDKSTTKKETKIPEDKPTVAKKAKKTENKKNGKSASDQIFLQDLLGNTLPEDSEDEDWSENDIVEGADYEDSLFIDSNAEDDDDEEKNVVTTLKPNLKKKPIKAASNTEKIEKLLKRKPQAGGIKKMGKKTTSKKTTTLVAKISNNKSSMLLSAAKEAAKPMSKSNLQKKSLAATKKSVNKKQNKI